MQRAYYVLVFGLTAFLQVLTADASSYEYKGKIYNFRQESQVEQPQASPAGEQQRTALDEQNPNKQLMNKLEADGYVFRPMRKRKTLDDPPVRDNRGQQNPGYRFEACPTPQARQQMPQVTPVNPAYAYPAPAVPGYPAMPVNPGTMPSPLGYPYTLPSPYSFPYPSGGAMPGGMPMPYPGGYGFPGW